MDPMSRYQAAAASGVCVQKTSMKLRIPSKLSIVLYPHPVLKKISTPVTEFGGELKALGARMLALMHEAEGVGLAAPQIGLAIRMFVYNVGKEANEDRICVNPTVAELTGAEEHEEGCLSIPGVKVTMRRATHAVLRAYDTDGVAFELAGEDLQARVWQHEIDHLNGRLIVDHMSAVDEIANRQVIRQLRDNFTA